MDKSGQVLDLDLNDIQSRLRTTKYGRSLCILGITDSTNDDARNDAQAGAIDGHVIVADTQRSGRGSHNRIWSSPPQTDLYLSIIDRPKTKPQQLPPLTLAVGLGVAETVEQALDQHHQIQVKWPNDVWVDGRKCAGILIEAISQSDQVNAVVIGIGLNVNRKQWPEDLRSIATSLWSSQGQGPAFDRSVVLIDLLDKVERWVHRFITEGPGPVVKALRKRLALVGQRVTCNDVTGILVGVAENGALCIKTEHGIQDVTSGTLLPLQTYR